MKSFLHSAVFKILILLICVLPTLPTKAQHIMFGNEKIQVEAGLNFGPTFFLGDLGGNRGKGSTFVKDVNLELTKLMKGAFISVYPNKWLGLRVAAQYTYVEGSDAVINTTGIHESWRKERNLDFKSDLWEVYTAVELYPTMLFAKYDDYEPFLKPYGFIGVGLFHFDPQGSITDNAGNKTWYKLRPLRTEGQGMAEYPDRKPYKKIEMNLPMGAGVKIALTPRVSTALELLYRKTFTDYIDDVSTRYIDPNYFDQYLSAADATIARKIHDKTFGVVTPGLTRYQPGTQRGNPKNNDAYFSFAVKVGIKLGFDNSTDKRRATQTRCPHFY